MKQASTPFAELLPPLSGSEFDALTASIKTDGVRVPIIVDEAGNILDGHHRYRIAPDAPRRVVKGLTDAGKRAYVLSSNLHRRNLSSDQKTELRKTLIEIAGALKAEGRTQEDIAAMLGVAQRTVSDWLINNSGAAKAYNPDVRVKLSSAAKQQATDRVQDGEAQAQIAADYGVSQARISQIAKAEKKRREREQELAQQRADIARGDVIVGAGPYDVIVVDPPWPYGTKYEPTGRRAANPFPEESLEWIAEDGLREIRDKAAPDCILWFWTTHAFMRHSYPLLDAWGFQEKVIVTWDKGRMGLGVWLRSQSEFCIMAVRGSPTVTLTDQTTILHGKARQHSRKPEEFYGFVESLCPGVRRYDRFSREERKGWHVGGNDALRFAS